jgi:hypothetical protein
MAHVGMLGHDPVNHGDEFVIALPPVVRADKGVQGGSVHQFVSWVFACQIPWTGVMVRACVSASLAVNARTKNTGTNGESGLTA